jgi:predicted transcriptional regulator
MGDMMLKPLLGSENTERILMFLLARDSGYASEIAAFYNTDYGPVQGQLQKLEAGGILVSFLAGRTRLYEFNPSYAFITELKALLEKAFQFYSPDEIERLKMNRRRPRRSGKPL